ncbi:MAG: phage portal protein [Bifidobacteriaceae bacterium]|nr:phage portal protein [Bifidobacteriaceae bacterium]
MPTRRQRFAAWLGLRRRADDGGWLEHPTKLLPPPRPGTLGGDALSLSAVYRAISIIITAAKQLSIDAYKSGGVTNSPLTRQPDPDMPLSAWIEETVGCLAIHGEAYWWQTRNPQGTVTSLAVLDPTRVTGALDLAIGRPVYHYQGHTVGPRDIAHLKLMRRPGVVRGLGPIQAARTDLASHIDIRDYAASWFARDDTPSGILRTDQTITSDQAAALKTQWKETADGGVRVIGQGLVYSPLSLSPADAQWLESRTFSTQEICRLFGVPSTLMLIGVEGSSKTYTNAEQEWIAFVRFTLMQYLSEIESALSAALPHGTRARFNIDALLRGDTYTRYQAHQIALDAGFETIDEVRALEGLPPLNQLSPEDTP